MLLGSFTNVILQKSFNFYTSSHQHPSEFFVLTRENDFITGETIYGSWQEEKEECVYEEVLNSQECLEQKQNYSIVVAIILIAIALITSIALLSKKKKK